MNPSDDRTRVMGASAQAHHGHSDHSDLGGSNVLPVGTRLDEFEIIGLVGEGGFGIVYLALDHSLERRVALKEYMPSALASRGFGMQVSVKSQRHAETFETGLRSFVNEAKLLAHFDHDALVKVHRFWEANGTAYMVMPYYQGKTLKQTLRDLQERPSEQWLKSILLPLLDALELMHGRQCFHRDIAPDNVLILPDGRPVLLDFGAARRVIGDMTQALTVILKPGFAPIEQYADAPEMKQGPWTDVYALAALIYYAISGKAPAPAVARMMSDTITPARQLGQGAYSAPFLQAIDDALVVQPQHRTASMTLFRQALGIGPGSSAHVDSVHTAFDPYLDGLGTMQPNQRLPTRSTFAPHPSEPLPLPLPLPTPMQTPMRTTVGVPAQPAAAAIGAGASRRSRTWLLLPAAVLTLALAGSVGWWLYRTGTQSSSPITRGESSQPKPATGSHSQPGAQPTTAPSATGGGPVIAPELPPLPSDPGAAPGSAPVAEAKVAFSPSAVTELLFRARSQDWPLNASANPVVAQIDKDSVRFSIQSERAGFLYIFMFDADQQHWWLVFPNGRDRDNRLTAGAPLLLPRKSWSLTPSGPPGITRFLALATENRRDFSAAGLKIGPDFGEFDLAAAASAYQAAADPVTIFAGSAQCADGQPACARQFAAAQFQIEEISGRNLTKKRDAVLTK